MLASTANNQYMLDYHLTSSTVSGASYTFSGEGTIEISKESLTKEIKKLILGKWAPEVRASNKVLKLTQLARLGIGCCQFLIFTDLKVAPESPHDKGTLSPVLAHVTIGLINALIEEIMHPVRNSHLELDPETRPGLVLWYIYLSRSLFPNLSNATRCQLYVSTFIPEFPPGSYDLRRTILKESYFSTSRKYCGFFYKSSSSVLRQTVRIRRSGRLDLLRREP
jgi:hypothetical protein